MEENRVKKVKWWMLVLCMIVVMSSLPVEISYAFGKIVEQGDSSEQSEENQGEGNTQDGEDSEQGEDKEETPEEEVPKEEAPEEEVPDSGNEDTDEEFQKPDGESKPDEEENTENEDLIGKEEIPEEELGFENEEQDLSIQLSDLKCQVHVRNIGWMDWVPLGEMLGTTGKGNAIEAITIKSDNVQVKADSIQYRVHVQDIGLMNWASLGETAGTMGAAKQIEAIEFRLSEDAANKYNLYYQAHIAQFGWLGWAQSGELAGSEGLSKGIECLKLKLVEKSNPADTPDLTGDSYIKASGIGSLRYSGHVRNIGDVAEQKNGATLGTVGKKLALEGVKIRLAIPDESYVSGGVQYRTHVTNIGWQDWMSNGQFAGTTGKALSVEAIEIKLTGDIAKYYDVYYRAHVQNLGWLGWAKNGQTSGTAKMAYRMEALQVRLVAKGNPAPGSTSGYYKEGKVGWRYEGGYKFYYKNNVKQLDLDGILPKQSSYYIKVNRKTCSVTVYAKDGDNGYIIPVKRFACSVGFPATPTPTGTYYTPAKYRWHTLMGPSYGQYCTRITGSILFHSVAGHNKTSFNINAKDYNKLGQPASHGCVRLNVRDAKWIYDNCPLKTKVTIYDSSDPGPLGKPPTIKIPAGQTWDPTDPNVKS